MTPEQRCLQLLQETNRPYNVQNVADLLACHGVKKTQVDKTLTSLAASGKITCKEFGKIKIYFPKQEEAKELSGEEQKTRMVENESLQKEMKELDEEVSALKKELQEYSLKLSMKEMQEKYIKLQEEAEELDCKLSRNQQGAGTRISCEDVSKAEKCLKECMDIWKKRKRCFRDIWDTVSENFDGNQKEIFADLGVELDEDLNEHLNNYAKMLAKKAKT